MNIIVNSTFNPFTFKDLMQPVYDYKQAYEQTEAAYSDLVTQTEAWKDIANRENSPEAYEMYRNYANQLNAIVNDFSQGMNPRNRSQLLGMKRRYASEIIPIARASEAMNAANALRDQAGPDAIFEVGRYNSIDDFLHGKTANNKFESRKDIAARTAALTQATAQSIIEDPIIRQSMNPQFLEVIQKRGIGSLDELQAAIAGNPEAANRFAQIKSQMIDQIGGLDRFDAQGRSAIEGAINEGLYAGLNNYQTQLQQNGEYMTRAQRISAAQNAEQLAFQKEKYNYELAKSEGRVPVAVSADGSKIYSNAAGESWKSTPVKKFDKDRGHMVYEYKDSAGKIYYGNTPYGYKTPSGEMAQLQYKNTAYITPTSSNPSSNPSSKSTKLGDIIGVTNLRMAENGKDAAVFDKNLTGKTYNKEDLEGATRVPYIELTKAEDIYVNQFLKDYPGVKKENLAFYRQWVDKDGDICEPDADGARQVLLITDVK